MQIIKSIEELKKLSEDGIEVEILLGGGFFKSTKYVQYNKDNKRFYILNYIDGSSQNLKEENLGKFTNIVEAINKECLIKA